MQEIEGKIISTEIEEIADPSHTPLVTLGAQDTAVDLIFNKDEFMTSLNSFVQSARDSISVYVNNFICCLFYTL
jgi:hypothetical protein